MDKRRQWIKKLRQGFKKHPAISFMQVTLEDLCILDNRTALAIVHSMARPEFLVYSDIAPGKVVQGGFTAVIANFACVYAAMALSDGHTLLYKIEENLKEKIVEGEVIIAEAHARRAGERDIGVFFILKNDEGHEKASGTMWYREKRKQQ